jgi:hypothetical protein
MAGTVEYCCRVGRVGREGERGRGDDGSHQVEMADPQRTWRTWLTSRYLLTTTTNLSYNRWLALTPCFGLSDTMPLNKHTGSYA